MSDNFQCELISWNEFYKLARNLAFTIHATGFEPEAIIAIGRGGYMPARILSDFLGIMNLTSFKIEHYKGSRKEPTAKVAYPLPSNIKANRVLIVDDVSDSGDTFTVAMDHVRQRLPDSDVRTAVIHHKKVSSYAPDFYAKKVTTWRWIIYPWAIMEDLAGFMQELKPRPESIEEIAQKIRQRHGIKIPHQTIQDLLNLMPQ
jgi:hypoxanthine phosphoribosyltransferase